MGVLFPVSRGISRAAEPGAAAEELRLDINAAKAEVTGGAGRKATGKGAGGGAAASARDAFVSFALAMGVLRFGDFTLKSGRTPPYFFNAGLFNTGGALLKLGRFYAGAIADSGIAFDVLFGPAYKGIPLVAAIAMALVEKH